MVYRLIAASRSTNIAGAPETLWPLDARRRSPRTIGQRGAALALASLLVVAASQSAFAKPSITARLAGTWTENEAKRQIGAGATPLRFQLDAQGNLEELRGPVARPLIQQVHFDGKIYPGDAGPSTISWKQTGENQYERQLFKSGKLVSTRRLLIAPDGKTLTQENEVTLTDGKPSVQTTVFRRTSGGLKGLVGIWKPESIHTSDPLQITYAVIGHRLRFWNNTGATYIVSLDNKPTSYTGSGVISGTMIAARQVDANTLETVLSREGVLTVKNTITVSPNDMQMTITSINISPDASGEPSVLVYDKTVLDEDAPPPGAERVSVPLEPIEMQ